MKYVVITNYRNKYFVVNPTAKIAGSKWRLTIPGAIADIHNPEHNLSKHTIFEYLKVNDSDEYYIDSDDTYYEIHSIIDSDTNPEFFI